jgi:hypothetical protein
VAELGIYISFAVSLEHLSSLTFVLKHCRRSPSGPSGSGGGGSNAGLIAGVVVGVIALLAIGAFLLWFFLRRRRVQHIRSAKSERDAPPLTLSRGPSPGNGQTQAAFANTAPAGSYIPPVPGSSYAESSTAAETDAGPYRWGHFSDNFF